MATFDDPVYVVQMTASVTAAPEDYTAVRPFNVFDAHVVVVTAGAALGATILSRGSPLFVALSDAILETNGVAGTLVRAALIATAQADFVATNVLRNAESVEVAGGVFDTYVRVLPQAA